MSGIKMKIVKNNILFEGQSISERKGYLQFFLICIMGIITEIIPQTVVVRIK